MKLKKDHWHIAYKFKEEKVFHLIKNTSSYWVADPFLFYHNGVLFLFAELFYYKKNRGVIGYSRFENNCFSEWNIAIEEPWHLSFPFIAQQDGKIYICPEGYKSGKYYAYEAVDFPHTWRRLAPIIDDGNLYVDSLFFRDTKSNAVYFFAYQMNPSNHSRGELFLYYFSKQRFSDCQRIETQYPRSGGKIFEHNGKLIRVAQNCDMEYGHGLVFYEIIFNRKQYKEKLLKKIYSEDIITDSHKKFCGIHTYNVCHGLQVIDLKTKDISLFEIFYRIMRRIVKLWHRYFLIK